MLTWRRPAAAPPRCYSVQVSRQRRKSGNKFESINIGVEAQHLFYVMEFKLEKDGRIKTTFSRTDTSSAAMARIPRYSASGIGMLAFIGLLQDSLPLL
jgi:hypothetical protein